MSAAAEEAYAAGIKARRDEDVPGAIAFLTDNRSLVKRAEDIVDHYLTGDPWLDDIEGELRAHGLVPDMAAWQDAVDAARALNEVRGDYAVLGPDCPTGVRLRDFADGYIAAQEVHLQDALSALAGGL